MSKNKISLNSPKGSLFSFFNLFLEFYFYFYLFWGENFSIPTNDIISVEAAKVLCSIDTPPPPKTFDSLQHREFEPLLGKYFDFC